MTDDSVMCVASCTLGNSLWPPRDVACQPEDEDQLKQRPRLLFSEVLGWGQGYGRPQEDWGSFLWPLSFPGFVILPIGSWLLIIRGREKTVGSQHGIWQNLVSTALLISQLKVPGTRELASRGWRVYSLFLCMCSLQNHWVTLELLVVLHLLV